MVSERTRRVGQWDSVPGERLVTVNRSYSASKIQSAVQSTIGCSFVYPVCLVYVIFLYMRLMLLKYGICNTFTSMVFPFGGVRGVTFLFCRGQVFGTATDD